MKKLLLFLCLSFLSGKVFCQSYKPFPDSNAYWIDVHENYPCCPFNVLSWNYQNEIAGDTIANGFAYHKITETGYFDDMNNSFHALYSHSYHAYRQDTINHKVFHFDMLSGIESLLYDFNLNAGDTLPPAYNNPTYPGIIVTSIDSILLSDGYHRQYFLNTPCFPFDSASIIEGIGTTFGLFNAITGIVEGRSNLICFSNNNLPMYPDTATLCNLVIGMKDNFSKNIFSLSPNPTRDFLNIKNNQQKDLSITIFSSIGQVVTRTTIMKDGATSINLYALPAGIYLVTAKSEKNYAFRKFVKQ